MAVLSTLRNRVSDKSSARDGSRGARRRARSSMNGDTGGAMAAPPTRGGSVDVASTRSGVRSVRTARCVVWESITPGDGDEVKGEPGVFRAMRSPLRTRAMACASLWQRKWSATSPGFEPTPVVSFVCGNGPDNGYRRGLGRYGGGNLSRHDRQIGIVLVLTPFTDHGSAVGLHLVVG